MEDHAAALTQIAIVLAAAFAGGALVRRLNQPVLVGYILVGCLLGPSFLGVVNDQHQISLLAELGILLLLFVVGMELDVRRFAEVYKIAITTTVLQIGAGLGLMALLGHLFDWPMSRILVFGFVLSLSSTAVGIRLLDDMGELKKPTGNTALGILIAQDLALIPMLLIVGSMQSGGGMDMAGLAKLAFAVIFMAVLIVAMTRHGLTLEKILPRWLLHPVFKNKEQQMLVALAFCFSIAAFCGSVGLSASYGAFLAGLLIGSTSESHDYEKQIKPLFDLLIMVFFFSVGLLLDVPFIIENFIVIAALLLAVMIMKTVFNVLVLSLLGLSRRHAFIIGASLGQIGEFSFVLAAMGLAAGAIMEDGYKFAVAVIALSLIMTPLWMVLLQRMHLVRKAIGDHA